MTALPARLPIAPRLRYALWLLAAVGLAWLVEPGAQGLSLLGWTVPDLCPLDRLGAACAGCGTTRAGLSLLRGDWAAAWAFQPAIFLFAGAVLAPFLPLRPGVGRRLATVLAWTGAAVAVLRMLL